MKQSCWNGLLAGGLVSMDNFSNEAAIFLLSHAHTDHMVGLVDGWSRGPLYTTEQNRAFVLQRFRIDPKWLHSLTMYEPMTLAVGAAREQLKVVALPANHCPGSAMFHIEDRHGERSLATGDFRYCDAMLREPLLRRVDTLYLDTTFLDPQFSSFPTKEQSVQIVIDLIEQKRVGNERVHLEMDQLGCEQILLAVAKRFRCKLWVQNAQRAAAMRLPFERIVTDNRDETPFHIVSFSTLTVVAHATDMATVVDAPDKRKGGLFIKASVQYFFRGGYNDLVPGMRPIEASGVWHVLYSTHSSHAELLRFVSHVQPRKVVPITDCDASSVRALLPDKRLRRSAEVSHQ